MKYSVSDMDGSALIEATSPADAAREFGRQITEQGGGPLDGHVVCVVYPGGYDEYVLSSWFTVTAKRKPK